MFSEHRFESANCNLWKNQESAANKRIRLVCKGNKVVQRMLSDQMNQSSLLKIETQDQYLITNPDAVDDLFIVNIDERTICLPEGEKRTEVASRTTARTLLASTAEATRSEGQSLTLYCT